MLRAVRARHRLGDEHVAVGQHVDPARMIETGRKRIDLEPGCRDRRLPGPSLGGRHLERRDAALRFCRRDRRRAAPGRLGRAALRRRTRTAAPPITATIARKWPTSSIHCVPLSRAPVGYGTRRTLLLPNSGTNSASTRGAPTGVRTRPTAGAAGH